MSALAALSPAAPARTTRPRSVLCCVEPSLASFAVARRAVEAAGAGRVTFVAVASSSGQTVDPAYVNAAVFLARRDGRAPDVGRVEGVRPVSRVLAAARAHDLLVVAAPARPSEHSPLVDAALRRAGTPVLVARALPDGDALGDRVVLVAGTGGDDRAAIVATAIARDAGSEITAVVGDHRGSADAILREAARAGATLVVIGGPGRDATDLDAAVAHRAACPVLVARERARQSRDDRGRVTRASTRAASGMRAERQT